MGLGKPPCPRPLVRRGGVPELERGAEEHQLKYTKIFLPCRTGGGIHGERWRESEICIDRSARKGWPGTNSIDSRVFVAEPLSSAMELEWPRKVWLRMMQSVVTFQSRTEDHDI